MENNIDLVLQFFVIRPSLEAGAHLASVECVAHYLMVAAFYRDLGMEMLLSLHARSHGIAVMCSEMDLFLMTAVGLRRPAELILCAKEGRERPPRKGCGAKGHHQSPSSFHTSRVNHAPFFFFFPVLLFNGVTIIARLMEARSHAS